MKRLLFIPLVLISISFSQSTAYEDSTYYLIDINSDTTNILWYRLSSSVFNNYFEYYEIDGQYGTKDYKDVQKIYNTRGDILYPDIGINTVSKVYISDSTKPQKTISRRGGYGGGVLIAIGAGMLYSNIGKECDDCDTQALIEFVKSLESTQKAGYVFIFLGGILVALGI